MIDSELKKIQSFHVPKRTPRKKFSELSKIDMDSSFSLNTLSSNVTDPLGDKNSIIKSLWLVISKVTAFPISFRELGGIVDSFLWCLSGEISKSDFTTLWEAWCERGEYQEGRGVGLKSLRRLLVERWCSINEITLMLGLAIFEEGRNLFSPSSSSSSLLLLTPQWMSLVNMVFFMLDVSGKGVIGFDELLFFVLSLHHQPAENTSFFWYSSTLQLMKVPLII